MVAAVESMAWNGETPWHNLGVRVEDNLSPLDMLKHAGLDWTVEKVPMTYEGKDGKTHTVKDQKALVRSSDNKLMSIVGNKWNPVQNEEAFTFFDDFVRSGDMQMHTAGSLCEGKKVWALAKINESFRVNGNDIVESYLLFSNPHQLGQCIDVRFTPIRVVCNNTLTLSLSLKSDQMVKLNHRSKFNPDTVKEMLGIASSKLKQYEEMAKFLQSKRHDRRSLETFVSQLFPAPEAKQKDNVIVLSRSANEVLDLMETQPGHEMAAGTWWDAFNSITFYTDHVKGRGVDTRLTSAWYGAGRGLKLKALETAVEMAKVA